jgi:long-chain acyl-CoA synthetase
MNFLESILDRLRKTPERPVLQEARSSGLVTTGCGELLRLVGAARAFLVQAGLKKGDRCALLAHNSVRWAALDLAMMAEGIIVVPLYARQAPEELVAMMKDCQASLVFCGDESLRDAVAAAWPEAPPRILLDKVFAAAAGQSSDAPAALADGDAITIIYTSGTSGEAKGVILTVGNLNHMLSCTTARLDLLMGPRQEPDQVFHYLPFCFAGSWVLLLTCLSRSGVLTLSTDLTRLADEIRLAKPHYFLNVPTLLERIRAGVERELEKRGGVGLKIYQRAIAAWLRSQAGKSRGLDPVCLAVANRTVFAAIRKPLGPNLRALICGSAPLAKETQLFFLMLGVRVLQVYGLTETTAICTMDHPERIEPGCVGPAIAGIDMKLGADDEILVRGPNVFPGYWNRPQETAKVLRDGWFHTGDQGGVDNAGNWCIIGRLKNLIILNSGHNIAPEPLEEMLLRRLGSAQQVVLMGNGRSYLTALVTGEVAREQTQAELDAMNAQLPHYKQIRAFHLEKEPFTIENGLLTANGKLKRDAIAARFEARIEELYRRKGA